MLWYNRLTFVCNHQTSLYWLTQSCLTWKRQILKIRSYLFLNCFRHSRTNTPCEAIAFERWMYLAVAKELWLLPSKINFVIRSILYLKCLRRSGTNTLHSAHWAIAFERIAKELCLLLSSCENIFLSFAPISMLWYKSDKCQKKIVCRTYLSLKCLRPSHTNTLHKAIAFQRRTYLVVAKKLCLLLSSGSNRRPLDNQSVGPSHTSSMECLLALTSLQSALGAPAQTHRAKW